MILFYEQPQISSTCIIALLIQSTKIDCTKLRSCRYPRMDTYQKYFQIVNNDFQVEIQGQLWVFGLNQGLSSVRSNLRSGLSFLEHYRVFILFYLAYSLSVLVLGLTWGSLVCFVWSMDVFSSVLGQ